MNRPPLGDGSHVLEGPAGSGKTRALVDRAAALLEADVPGREILVLLPDQDATLRFRARLERACPGALSGPSCTTYYSLATQGLREHWQALAEPAGFAADIVEPSFIDYEIAQQMMASIALPLHAGGYFEGLAIRPQRLVSQLLDGLNKAATGGFPLEEVEPRLVEAWSGDPERLRHYAQAGECMRRYRQRCLNRGLVDISLALASYHQHVFGDAGRRAAQLGQYRHLLVDDLEESVPVAQALIAWLIERCASSVLALDPEAGHRVFLGADPLGASQLAERCGHRHRLHRPEALAPCSSLAELALSELSRGSSSRRAALPWAAAEGDRGPSLELPHPAQESPVDRALAATALLGAVECEARATMIEAAAEAVAEQVRGGLPASEIALLAPYVDGVLHFGLQEALARRGIAIEIHRRHQPLRERPIVRAALTAAALAGMPPPAEAFAVAELFDQVLPAVDPVRAALLVRSLYARAEGKLAPAAALGARERDRLGPAAIEDYERLRTWLDAHDMRAEDEAGAEGERAPAPVTAAQDIDRWLGALFEAMARWRRPSPIEAVACQQLLSSAQGFREAAPALGLAPTEIGPAFAEMVESGIVAAREPGPGADAVPAVLLAPAHAYLVEDRRHPVQIWLDTASPGWWSPPHQPLTNPWILSPHWPRGRRWSQTLDQTLRDAVLARLAAGLARRAGTGIWALASISAPGGLPLEGPLWRMCRDLAGPRLHILATEPEAGA